MDAQTSPESSVRRRVVSTHCCIVGGGPAGMMLGYLMGRAGIETLVLEKHADFLRFRECTSADYRLNTFCSVLRMGSYGSRR